MKSHFYLFFGIFTFICGSLFFSFYHGYVILFFPSHSFEQHSFSNRRSEKKTIILHYWHRNSWHKEEAEILWSSEQETSILHIIQAWLNLLDEEGITPKKISVQSTLLSPSSHELYISFDRNPLLKENSIFEKIIWIESLLKTLRANNISFSAIHFLVHHQPINDAHLDFSHAWPGEGFIEH